MNEPTEQPPHSCPYSCCLSLDYVSHGFQHLYSLGEAEVNKHYSAWDVVCQFLDEVGK